MLRLNQDRSSYLLALFFLLGVLVPSGSVLWFMNDAATSQAEAARQRVTEAYRGQLRLLRGRVDEWWKSRSAALDHAARFDQALHAMNADAVILLDEHGSLVYPTPPLYAASDTTSERADWQQAEAREREKKLDEAAALWEKLARSERDPNRAARAMQSWVRCLVRMGRKDAAIAVIENCLSRLGEARDLEGHLIGADEQLLAFRIMRRTDARFPALVQRLAAALNDYTLAMPSAQRLFLMGEMRGLAAFPTYSAELLAQQILEAERLRPGGPELEPTAIRGLWKFTAPNGRALALYRTATVVSLLDKFLGEENPSHNSRVALSPLGAPASDEAISAGVSLPGWQLSLALVDVAPLDEAARRRRTVYIWLGCAVIGATMLAGILAVQFFRRQAQLNRLKTDLLAAVSHELKTPLASMRLLVETLLEDGQQDAVKTREYLQLIAGENVRLSRLVENFLTFSRIERNRQRFEFAEIRPADVTDAAISAMRERLQAPSCRLEMDVSPNLPPILADHDALTTVLLNLLDNACKYSPSEKHIRVRAHFDTGFVAFEVEDNGIGIAPREQKRIFRRFYQVDRRLARETGGCGLGLSIVEFIVRAHGGDVSVESRLGAGSTFRVRLPARAASCEAAA